MAAECINRKVCQALTAPSLEVDDASLLFQKKFGVSRKIEGNLSIYTFRIWAPRADSVHLVGDFVGWENGRPMTALSHGVWEYHLTTETPLEGSKYKYKLFFRDKAVYLADPYAKQLEASSQAASVLLTNFRFLFGDDHWLTHREKESKTPFKKRAFHAYEVNAAWRTHGGRPTNEPFSLYGFKDFADAITPYVKGLGYTHIYLSPELFSEESRFAPPSRLGSFEDFLYLVNKLHANGVGILLPILPLEKRSPLFDGVCATVCPSFLSYLLLTLFHFTERCHIDGFVCDTDDETSVAFAALAAREIKKQYPELIFLHKGSPSVFADAFDAESSIATEEAHRRHLATDPIFRHHHLADLTLPNEGLLCEPPTHQCSLMAGFFGSYDNKFATARLYHLFRLFQPAKPFSYMGNELAPFERRNPSRELEWFLLDFPAHRHHFDFVKAANVFYLEHTPLYQGAATILYENACDNLIVIQKESEEGCLYGIFNFAQKRHECYQLPIARTCRLLFSTEACKNGEAEILSASGCITLNLSPLSGMILQPLL